MIAGGWLVSRTIAGNAKALFDQTTEQGLEGIVQKKKDSPYRMGKRSRDWVKVKNLVDEDFLACGYIAKGEQITSLVLGSMDAPLRYMGHVTLGVSRNVACRFPTTPSCPFDMLPSGNEGAVWYKNRPSVSSPIWNEPARAACGNQDSMASERIKVLLRSLFLSLIPIVDDTITAPLVLNRKTIRAKFLKSCVLLCEKHIAAPFAHAARKLISNFH